jgi:hypothetical protein
MSEQREAWSPPRDWRGDIEVEVRAADGAQTLTLPEATRDDWDRVDAALTEVAQRHAYAKARRERAKRERDREREPVRPRANPSGEVAVEDEPEPGHTGPSTGHS